MLFHREIPNRSRENVVGRRDRRAEPLLPRLERRESFPRRNSELKTPTPIGANHQRNGGARALVVRSSSKRLVKDFQNLL